MTFPELIATATVGTAQRPVPELPAALLDPAEGPAAVRLLDAAAAYAVVSRAAPPGVPDGSVPEPAPDDPTPVPPGRFTAAFAKYLGDLDSDRRELSVKQSNELVAEVVGWVAAAGWRVPDRLLVPLLQRCARDRTVGAAAGPAIGVRGRWLATMNPAWDAAIHPAAAKRTRGLTRRDWDSGRQRPAYLAAVREEDPDAARALLEESWETEAVDDRVMFAAVIAERPVAADEGFLDRASGDRSAQVAAVARVGLARLPGSALRERMRARARQAVGVRRSLTGRVVRLEPLPNDALSRQSAVEDGLDQGGFSQTAAENELNAMVALLDPRDWPELVGVRAIDLLHARSPESWSVVNGLVAAAVRFGDRDLAGDLLGAGLHTPELLRRADPVQVARLLQDPAVSLPGETVATAVADWPTPWPAVLAQGLGSWLARTAGDGPGAGGVPPALFAQAATAVPVTVARGWANRLRGLAEATGIPPATRRRVQSAASVLTLRAAMYDDVRAAIERRTPPEPEEDP